MPDEDDPIQQLTAVFKQLVEKLQPASVPQVASLEPFDESQETFTTYVQRLQNFLALKGLTGDDNVTREKKVQVLINCLSTKHYQLLASLTAPELPSTLAFDDLIGLLTKHLSPTPNVITERHKFISRLQQDGESIAQYVAALKQLTTYSDFNCNHCHRCIAPLFLQMQFVRGVRDADMREKLLQTPEKNFDKLVEKAVAIETARIESKQLRPPPANNSSAGSNSSNLNKIKSTNFSRPPQYGKKPQNSKPAEKTEFQCFRCGAKDHKADKCKADRTKLYCSSCNKKGHVASVCMEGKRSKGKKPPNPNQKNSFVRALDDDTDDWGTLNSITHVNEISSKSGPNAALFMLDVMLNNHPIRFEVDSGSKFTVIEETVYQKLQPVPKLLSTDVFLAAYDGTPLVVLGEALVHVTFHNRQFKTTLIVVQRGKAVLGRL